MPCDFNLSAVLTELATAPLIRPLIFASSSMNKSAVDPEPTPIHASDNVLDRFSCDGLLLLVLGHGARRLFLAGRRQIGAHAFEQLGCEPDRLGKRWMRMDCASEVDGVSAHLDG